MDNRLELCMESEVSGGSILLKLLLQDLPGFRGSFTVLNLDTDIRSADEVDSTEECCGYLLPSLYVLTVVWVGHQSWLLLSAVDNVPGLLT